MLALTYRWKHYYHNHNISDDCHFQEKNRYNQNHDNHFMHDKSHTPRHTKQTDVRDSSSLDKYTSKTRIGLELISNTNIRGMSRTSNLLD